MSDQDLEIAEWIESGYGPLDEPVLCYVPATYQGPCAITYLRRGQVHWAIFPCREVAISAAAVAAQYDLGGYSNVSIHVVPAGLEARSYERVEHWLFEGQIEFDEVATAPPVG